MSTLGSDAVETYKWLGNKDQNLYIGVMKMNAPRRKNSFNPGMYRGLLDALTQFENDPDVPCVVITGTGDTFTSGADLQEATTLNLVREFMIRVIEYPKVLVAAVNGLAIGIGTTLLPHCDLVYASDNAAFWTPFTRIAIIPEFCSSYTFPKVMVRWRWSFEHLS